MNIFVLDTDVDKCAQYHNDRHCVKMILETTQLLNNALIKRAAQYQPVYRQTHKNHPCSVWAAESLTNFNWLNKLGLSLCYEYTYRYGKQHKCQNILEEFLITPLVNTLPDIGMTPFVLCMPDNYKSNDAVESYRFLYKNAKNHLAKWSRRGEPNWWNKIKIL